MVRCEQHSSSITPFVLSRTSPLQVSVDIFFETAVYLAYTKYINKSCFSPGVAPPSFGFISAGVELYVLTTTGDALSFKSISIVVISAILSLTPVLFRKQLKRKLE